MYDYNIKTTYDPGSSKAWLGYPQDASMNVSVVLSVTEDLLDVVNEDGVIYSGLPVSIADGVATYNATNPRGFIYNDIVLKPDNIKDDMIGKLYPVAVIISGAIYPSKLPYEVSSTGLYFVNLEEIK